MSNYSSNDVSLIGRVGKDLVISGRDETLIVTVILATNESWHDKDGKIVEHTDWHSVVFFNKTARIVKEHVTKGMLLHIKGKLRTSKWSDKENIEHYKTQVIANKVGFLEKKLSEIVVPESA